MGSGKPVECVKDEDEEDDDEGWLYGAKDCSG